MSEKLTDEQMKLAAELALAAKRKSGSVGSAQLEGTALDLYLNKKTFELENIIRDEGATVDTLPEKKVFDPNVQNEV